MFLKGLARGSQAVLTYGLNHNALLFLDVEHHIAGDGEWSRLLKTEAAQENDSPVLLCLLDVLKVGLALIGHGDSGGLQIRVEVSTYPLHCHQLTMVDFFGLSFLFYLGLLPTAAAVWRRTTCGWVVRMPGRAPPVSSCHTPITAQNLVWPTFGKTVLSPREIETIMTRKEANKGVWGRWDAPPCDTCCISLF